MLSKDIAVVVVVFNNLINLRHKNFNICTAKRTVVYFVCTYTVSENKLAQTHTHTFSKA